MGCLSFLTWSPLSKGHRHSEFTPQSTQKGPGREGTRFFLGFLFPTSHPSLLNLED